MKPSGLISVNKDPGMSSHDVVNQMRKILGTKKVGHCGTLDQMATGVLPVCFGRATRACDYAQSADKTYIASMRLGLKSSTQDIWGEILETCESHVNQDLLEDILKHFCGMQKQVPPMVSALKQNGQRLYELARRGIEVERAAREITIFSIVLDSFDEEKQEATITVDCSKGTYIRSLCHDIGNALGVGAVMTALCRSRNGRYDLQSSYTLDELKKKKEEGTLDDCILSVASIFSQYAAYTLSEKEDEDMHHGRSFPTLLSDGVYVAYNRNQEFIGLCRVENKIFSLIKGFYETQIKGDTI